MRHIWLLAEEAQLGPLRRRLREQCAALGCFPAVRAFARPEALFEAMLRGAPDCVVSALPGVAGLNAVEYLRRLSPDCALVWISDLDFSLQAYRMRVDQFIFGPPGDDALREGLACCLERFSRFGLRNDGRINQNERG